MAGYQRVGVALLMATPLGACESVIGTEWIDPAIVMPDIMTGEVMGEPHIELGFYVEQLYRPLAPGDDCPIVHGLQGGTWVMPALRSTGIGAFAEITCRIETDGGEAVGMVSGKTQLYLAGDGFFELQAFPIPIRHAPPAEAAPIDDIYGQGATLTCSVDAGGSRKSTARVPVRLIDG